MFDISIYNKINANDLKMQSYFSFFDRLSQLLQLIKFLEIVARLFGLVKMKPFLNLGNFGFHRNAIALQIVFGLS
jgi:hypothetical protein